MIDWLPEGDKEQFATAQLSGEQAVFEGAKKKSAEDDVEQAVFSTRAAFKI